METKQINWGIIGCGNVCEVKSGPAFNLVENSTLAGVMRRDKKLVQAFARRHHVPRWYTNANDLIQDSEVNAIYIATPPNMHAPYAIKCMEAGKPVYVEKPMARNYSECQKMIAVSEKTGVPLYVAYYRRTLPYFLKIKEILDEGILGEVMTASLTHVIPPKLEDFDQANLPWRLKPEISGGGYFFDLACHQIDLLDFLLGPIKSVTGEFSNRAGLYDPEDTVVASLKFQSDVVASCCWCYAGAAANSVDRIEIFGTKGHLTFSISMRKPIEIYQADGKKTFMFDRPKQTQFYMIERIVKSLLGLQAFPENKESAARTSWAMDKILKRIQE